LSGVELDCAQSNDAKNNVKSINVPRKIFILKIGSVKFSQHWRQNQQQKLSGARKIAYLTLCAREAKTAL